MRLLFINDYHLPQVGRGVEVNTHSLCTALRADGHAVAVLAGLTGDGLVGLLGRARLKLDRRRVWTADRSMGYPTFRTWGTRQAMAETAALAMAEVAALWRPDAVICQACRQDFAEAALALGRRLVVYFHFIPRWAGLPDPGRVRFLTNSLYCQREIDGTYGIRSTVVRPLVRECDYRTDVMRQEVTAIGLSLSKGTDLVLDLAAGLPALPFRIFVNDARLGAEATTLLQRARAIGNLRIAARQRSGRRLYRRTRVLLAPSRALETWGRVATEAHVNDIPVLASDRGGLPESVGSGGRCLSPDAPVADWMAVLREMMEDDRAYAGWQRAIAQHRTMGEIAPARICADFLQAAAA